MATGGTNEQANRPVGSHEFREALAIVHEGLLNVVRFQLAMERKDRRVAMQRMDDVVVIERKLADFIFRSSPGSQDELSHAPDFREQRSALAKEKLTLAAGRSGPPEPADAQGLAQAHGSVAGSAPEVSASTGGAEPDRDEDRSHGARGARLKGYKRPAGARIWGAVASLLVAGAAAGGSLLDLERIGDLIPFVNGWEAKHGR